MLNHAWLSGFLMIQKNVTNGQKHFFSNLFQFTPKILTCRANSANDIALNAKKNFQETYYQKVFWEIFLAVLCYRLCTCNKIMKKAKASLYVWKKYIMLSLYLLKIICVKLFIIVKEERFLHNDER